MYTIDGKTTISLNHVERVETNARDKSIIFEMASGKSAVKKFDTQTEADAELIAVCSQIDLA